MYPELSTLDYQCLGFSPFSFIYREPNMHVLVWTITRLLYRSALCLLLLNVKVANVKVARTAAVMEVQSDKLM